MFMSTTGQFMTEFCVRGREGVKMKCVSGAREKFYFSTVIHASERGGGQKKSVYGFMMTLNK